MQIPYNLMDNKKPTKAILIANIGSPQSPNYTHVAKYLSRFLGHPNVITLPFLARKILVNGIIVPFRSFRSSKKYRKIWNGSTFPLVSYSGSLCSKLQQKLSQDSVVFFAMCFGPPYIYEILSQINEEGFEQLVVFPAFPHYTGSTIGLVRNMVEKEQEKQDKEMDIMYMNGFYNHPLYIQAMVNKIRQSDYHSYDHILFSYHGIPISHVEKNGKVGDSGYAQECLSTSDLIAKELDLEGEDYSSSFQSRMNKNWLSPFTDVVIERLAKKGVKKLLVVSPSFLVDCLETIEELGVEYQDVFMKAGGKEYRVVKCLNDDDNWIENLSNILQPLIKLK